MKTRLFASACAFAAAAGAGIHSAHAEVWKFGVISDTQWVTMNDGKSPASMPASMIQQIDKEFIAKGVKLVVAVGDTIDGSLTSELQVRQLYTQDLYNAGIAYYPLRGNHESGSANTGIQFAALWPQIVNGGQNNVPLTGFSISSIISGWSNNSYDTTATLSATLLTNLPPVANTGSIFTVGTNFSYPTSNGSAGNQMGTIAGGGLSYSFDYNNARFILIDQFHNYSSPLPSGAVSGSSTGAQLSWVSGRLSDAARPMQAFVFAHKNLLGGNHKDNLFGNALTNDPGDGWGATYTGTNLTTMNAKKATADSFISMLFDNNVRYYIGGHDHHHKHSLVYAPNTAGKWVEQIIAQSDSNKWYTPGSPFSGNEVSIDEDLDEVGYYIYTVDGPRVTADYYAVPAFNPSSVTQVLTGNWTKMLTIGYSLNGKTFQVDQGSSYTVVTDDTTDAVNNAASFGETGYVGTTLSLLSGVNASTKKTNDGRKLAKIVNTGWAPRDANTISDIATIWGLTELASGQTDTIKVAVSFNPASVTDPSSVVLGARDPKTGAWINAVDANIVGGAKQFFGGDYTSAPTTLGSYGVDYAHGIAWAVVNGDVRDFAIVATPTAKLPWDLNKDGSVTTADVALLTAAIRTKSKDLTYDLNNDGKVDASDSRWLTQHFTRAGGL